MSFLADCSKLLRVEPIERRIRPQGKWLAAAGYGGAVGVVVLGLFTGRALELGLLSVPRAVFPLVVMAGIGVGTLGIFAYLERPRCRKCNSELTDIHRCFAPAAGKQVLEAVHQNEPEQLGALAEATDENNCIRLTVARCLPTCLMAVTLKLSFIQEGVETEVRGQQALIGPSIHQWLELAGSKHGG